MHKSTNKHSVLVFIDWYLPAFKAGGPIVSCENMVQALKDEIDFSIVCSAYDYLDSQTLNGVELNKWTIAPDGTKVFYVTKEVSMKSAFKLIDHEEFDCYYMNSMFSLKFTIQPLRLIKDKSKIIIAPRGMLAPGALSVKPLKKKIFLLLSKIKAFYNDVRFHATSEVEKKQILLSVGNNTEVVVAPNFPSAFESQFSAKNKLPGVLNLISVARIAPEKNLLFALSALKNANPVFNIKFNLYGAVYDEKYWNQCLSVINTLPENIEVTYNGVFNPSRIKEVFANAHFLFMPTLGENYGHAIVNSLQSATPVIISNNTPWNKIHDYKAGAVFDLSDSTEFSEFINKVAACNQAEYNVFQEGAFAYAKEISSIEKLKIKYINMFY